MSAPAGPLSCLTCRERPAHLRGVCAPCYNRHKKAVREGKTTWAALVAAGRALDARPQGEGWRAWKMWGGGE